MATPRTLPPYIVGAKRAVWEYIRDNADPNGWVYFRRKDLPDLIVAADPDQARHHHLTLSRTIATLVDEGYVEYYPGNRATMSRARLLAEGEACETRSEDEGEGGPR